MEKKDNKHLMIIEDSVDLQTLLGHLFQRQGYSLSRAYNGLEGLETLRAMPALPSLIFLDIMMPVMDGLTFRKEISKDLRLANIPIVVMTADAHPEMKVKDLHFAEVVRKPVDMNRLLEIAEKYSTSQA